MQERLAIMYRHNALCSSSCIHNEYTGAVDLVDMNNTESPCVNKQVQLGMYQVSKYRYLES